MESLGVAEKCARGCARGDSKTTYYKKNNLRGGGKVGRGGDQRKMRKFTPGNFK